ncbi:MAG: hypothetical protein C5B50_03480 [Verrucomicrobia bacterium]|nr:MAG: hypothetical protein C5B50_03480 [Verrucomicrobiota bacterium]
MQEPDDNEKPPGTSSRPVGPSNTEFLDAPLGFIQALKRTQEHRVAIPPSVDEVILRTARQQLKSGPQSSKLQRFEGLGLLWRKLARLGEWQPNWGAPAAWIGATAVIALVIFLAVIHKGPSQNKSAEKAFVREDLNHDGQVDILDAFALARQLRDSSNLPQQLDINGDGVVDERDVEALATAAVKLAKGGRS